MVKIKGWKKIIDSKVKEQYNDTAMVEWHPKETTNLHYVFLDRPMHLGGKWRVVILYKYIKDVVERHFNTKEQATKFAIKYMRANPNG